jgi:hypothetical protein
MNIDERNNKIWENLRMICAQLENISSTTYNEKAVNKKKTILRRIEQDDV